MTREEAIERIKCRIGKQAWALDENDVEALYEVIPELRESEDERIRKAIMVYIDWLDGKKDCQPKGAYSIRDMLTYLEKQKENIEKEYVFRPLAGTDITIAAEQAIRRAKEGDHLVLAFNGVYLPVRKYNSAKELVDEYDAYLEKQKNASKAIEAVERIDKYIDEHLANAHDMEDSNPEKKYYRGWDDAIAEMAGILLDVYSGEKHKEQKCEEDDFTIYYPLKNGKGEYECIPYSFYGSLTSFSEDKDLIDFLRTCFYTEEECNEWIEQQQEQKQEWSEEDEERIQSILFSVGYCKEEYPNKKDYSKDINWLKSLSLYHKKMNEDVAKLCSNEWSEEDEKMIQSIVLELQGLIECSPNPPGFEIRVRKEQNWLKSLCPQSKWKPSEEQIEAFENCLESIPNKYFDDMCELYADLKKKMEE